MRAPGKKKTRTALPVISARQSAHVTLEARPDGNISARFDGYSVGLGKFSAAAAARAQALRTGLPLGAFAADGNIVDKEIDLLVRRLARSGLLEYRLGHFAGGKAKDQIVIEPQTPDYWPRTPKLENSETIVLSRFAYMRRRGNEMITRGFASRRRPVSNLRFGSGSFHCHARRLKIAGSGGDANFRIRGPCGFAGQLRNSFSGSMHPTAMASARAGRRQPRAIGIFTTFCSTQHGRPRQASPLSGLYPYAGVIAPPP